MLICLQLSILLFLQFLFSPSSAVTSTTSADLVLSSTAYEKTVPPNGNNVTIVSFDLFFDSVQEIDENKMHLSLNLNLYTTWSDSRLAYDKIPQISSFLK